MEGMNILKGVVSITIQGSRCHKINTRIGHLKTFSFLLTDRSADTTFLVPGRLK